MSHKESTIDHEECSARDLNHTRRLRAKVLEAFAGVKISKNRGYPDKTRILKLVMLARLPYLQ